MLGVNTQTEMGISAETIRKSWISNNGKWEIKVLAKDHDGSGHWDITFWIKDLKSGKVIQKGTHNHFLSSFSAQLEKMPKYIKDQVDAIAQELEEEIKVSNKLRGCNLQTDEEKTAATIEKADQAVENYKRVWNEKMSEPFKDQSACDLCGGSGRVGDDIECWECNGLSGPDPDDGTDFLEKMAKESEDHLEQLFRSDGPRPQISQEIQIANSVNRALYDIKESGEARVQDPHLEELVIKQLLEMGISVIRYKMDDHVVIEQDFD